jgi:alpha-1,6-mannosyltransferase
VIEGWLARPAVLRYLGLFGSMCCAVVGVLYGAPRQLRPGVSITSILAGPNGVLILLLWTVGLGALCTAWWYGRKLTGRGVLTGRWVLLTAALWAVPMLVTLPLASRDMYAYACQGALYDWGGNPYVQSVSDQPCPWLESVSVVWRDTPTPYGPLFIMVAGAAAAPGSQTVALVVARAFAVVSLVLLAAVLPVLARRRQVPVDRALWLVLCCPLVPVHLVGGGHNDAATVAFLVAGLAVLAAPRRRTGALVAGGALLGLAVAVKTTVGVVLPFAAVLAAGPGVFPDPRRRAAGTGPIAGLLPRRDDLVRLAVRGGTVLAASLGSLVALSFVSGLGLGWVNALSGAGKSITWTSPPSAVGLAVDAVGRWFGAQLHAVPVTRGVALVLLPVVLVAIWWRSRRGDPLVGAGLACLAVIFLAPITQPWYLIWPATLFAATAIRARWLAGTIVVSMFLLLPTGDGAWRYLQVPLSFAMTGLVGWVAWRSVAWWRSADPVPPAPDPPAADDPAARSDGLVDDVAPRRYPDRHA